MELTAFWRWWTAGTTSQLGSAAGALALPLTALNVLHASAFEMGLITAAGYLAYLLISLPAGVIVQRVPLRGMQVALDLIRALAVASVPVAWWYDALTVAQLVGVALVVSFANVLFDVANQTFLPEIVPAAQLQARNSLNSGTHAATQLGGPSLGGLAVQVLGAVPTLFVDAASYVVSAALLRTLPARRVQRPAQRTPMVTMIREGWHFVLRHPIIGPAMWDATVTNFVAGAMIALTPYYLVRELHASPLLVGLLIATDGLGALVGAAVTTRFTDRVGTARGLVIASVVGVAGALVIPLGTGVAAYVAFAVGSIVLAVSSVVLSVTTRTYRMLASPPDLLSRVIATVKFVSWGAIPLGGLLAGALAGPLSARTTLLIFAGLTVLSPVIYLSSPIRRLRDLPLDAAPQPVAART
ncbi:MFS transporter [Micromonospora mirobrigensis]|uniref:Predicted arabinose efflux permease, MFS family n=1 Tax=Micromonospora mirobrigensis TaxID=262898 RepID=A0A1C5AG09_9ACTN|nr:MFS transporter [Micromonospora mirobrigensis]SCF44089.1 Predicted arabinose efflux permease, MFS family [Micromonospora mirobrigensis]